MASDTREVNRRQEEAENRRKRLERLEEEETTAKAMFEEVNEKWEIMSSNNDPMDLKADIDSQKGMFILTKRFSIISNSVFTVLFSHTSSESTERCNELLEQKNAVIRDLMAELEAADLRFVKDQQRQLQEVSLLVQRIENQVKIMQEAYRRELQLIEVTTC